MKNMKMVLQALLCLVLVFSFTPMVHDGVTVVAGEDTSLLPVALTPSEVIEVQLFLQAGWNMVSVPVIPADNSTSLVFPRVAGIFTWNATSRSYYEPAVIEPEMGYWVAVTENITISINGTPIYNWTTDIKAGWNMIGSVNVTASIADPNDYHDGSVIPPVYWWDPIGRSYNLTTDIQAGKGYWVAATENCLLTLVASYEIACYENTEVVPEEEAENIVEVTENRTEILFEETTPFVVGIEPGDILVCNQSVPGAEYGFLERVTGVNNEGGAVEVQIEPATLEDAIEQGVIVVTQSISVQELMSNALWANDAEVTQIEAGYNFTYSPVEGVTIEGYVLATADAEVYIQASFWHGLEEFWFIFSPGLEMGATLTVENGVSWDKKYTIAEIPGPPIPIWGPVTITPSIELIVGTDGEVTGTFEVVVAYARSYDVGIKYYYGDWSTINEERGEGATLEPPSFSGQAEAKVYAGAALSGTADVAYVLQATLGAEVLGNIRASGEIETSPWRWQYDLELYLTAQVFAELGLLRIAKIRWEGPTWQYPEVPYNLAYGASGRVTTEGEEGLDGVQINFSGGHSSVTTDANGYWYKHLLRGTVVVTPEKDGYILDPPSRTITRSASNLDFQAVEEEVVYFPDPNLEAVIRETINKPSGPIYSSDLLTVTYLSASDPNISDLSGLEYCTNLADLQFVGNYNQVSDLSPLANLTNLTRLMLYSYEISDISPLSNLTNLTWLTVSSNKVSDISVLANLTNLTNLGFNYFRVSDISVLSNLTKLTRLALYGFLDPLSDISPLSNLTNLSYLNLHANEISDISALENLTNLRCLVIGHNPISDISALENLTNLEELQLSYNEISDILPLVENSGISDGDSVYLRYNPLSPTSINVYIPILQGRGVDVYY